MSECESEMCGWSIVHNCHVDRPLPHRSSLIIIGWSGEFFLFMIVFSTEGICNGKKKKLFFFLLPPRPGSLLIIMCGLEVVALGTFLSPPVCPSIHRSHHPLLVCWYYIEGPKGGKKVIMERNGKLEIGKAVK